MRKFFGIVLIVIGVPILLAGAAAAVLVGPDDTFDIASESIDADVSAVATNPGLLEVAGPAMHVTADGEGTAMFVGVAHPIHVDAYLADVPYREIAQISLGGDITSADRDGGQAAPAGEPAGLDWWTDESSGAGAQSVSFGLTGEPSRVVIMNSDMSTPVTADITIAAEVDGLFVTTLLVIVAGFAFVVGGIFLLRSSRNRKRASAAATAENEPKLADENTGDDIAASSPTRVDMRRGSRIVGMMGIGAVALAGCAEVPERVDVSEISAIPAATPDQVTEFFANYTKVNNAANAELDPDKIAGVESGTLLATSQFSYAEATAQDLDPIGPFDIMASSTTRPELDGYPLWYVATDEWDGEDEGATHYLITRPDPTTPWRAALSVAAPADAPIPEPVVDDDIAEVADDATIAAADDVLDRLVAYAEGGEAPDGVDIEHAEGLGSVRGLGIEIKDFDGDTGNVQLSCEIDDRDSLNWLTTTDGAMALASLSCTQSVRLSPGYWFQMDQKYGTIPTGVNLSGTEASASVTFIIGLNSDGTATIVDDGAQLTSTEHTKYQR